MSKKIKTWAAVKDIVSGVHDCNVDARVIVEALLLSTSKEDFTDLLMVAMHVGNDIEELCWGGEDN